MKASESQETPLDLCIVGAGIAGTVAAFRAQELGLRFALLEAERPLCRQRPMADIDRADTVVLEGLPSAASPWIADARLAAGSQSGIAEWVSQLAARDIPLEVATRVFAIEREGRASQATEASERDGDQVKGDDEVFCIRISERSSGREHRVRTRNVILATGDVVAAPSEPPGHDTGALDPRSAIGAAALVVGAGCDAVESVLAIAEAKATAKDPHPVYWSPGFADGDLVPAPGDLETGMGDRLLDALLMHRNIRTLAPLVSLRERAQVDGIARVVAQFEAHAQAGESASSPPLDFDAARVVRRDVSARVPASASQDDPGGGWPLLSGLAVRVERGDASSLPVVDRSGALSLSGLYLVGDACGGTRLVCDDFDAEANRAQYKRETHDRSIEAAASEAVLAVEAIAGFEPNEQPATSSSSTPSGIDNATADAHASPPATACWQVVALEADGSLGHGMPVDREVFEIGRRGRDLAEREDEHMADHHASLVLEDGEYYVADSGHGSGVWIRIDEDEGALVEDEDQIWLGSQILVASREGDAWTLVHYGADGRARDTHTVHQSDLTVGREADISLAHNDGLLSRRHARFTVEGEFLKVYDCGARNGTFVKVTGAHALTDGSEFRIATRGYRFERIG